MNLIEVKELAIPGIKVIKYGKHVDSRGYFVETLKKSDIENNKEFGFIRGVNFVQFNENFAVKDVLKGMHFQWEPPLGKLLRTVSGHMVDMMLDIRKNSPTEGKIILYDLPSRIGNEYGEWLWLPPGIAHGSFFLEDSLVEYFFSSEYNSHAEASISPLSDDFDWTLCDLELKEKFENFKNKKLLITTKDQEGFSLFDWQRDGRSKNFIYVSS